MPDLSAQRSAGLSKAVLDPVAADSFMTLRERGIFPPIAPEQQPRQFNQIHTDERLALVCDRPRTLVSELSYLAQGRPPLTIFLGCLRKIARRRLWI